MARTPTRTDLVEAHEFNIRNLRIDAIDYQTLARAYSDIADSIDKLRSQGQIYDTAKNKIYAAALEYANRARTHSEELSDAAKRLELRGVDNENNR